jgi:3-oxoacyl-[acyl-carrier-protein] synthase II
MTRVVITGLGPVSSIGVGVDAFAQALLDGVSGIDRITSFDPRGFPHVLAGEVRDWSAEKLVERISASKWGRSSLFAAAGARLALRDAGLDASDVDPDRADVVIGTTSGESQVLEALAAQVAAEGLAAMEPRLLAQLPAARLAAAVSEELAWNGESLTVSTACAASNYALGCAYDKLAAGEADVAIAGGADSVCRWAHAGFYRLGALAERCSPFDRGRAGIITGEGGAVLVLETLQHAEARGARPYAELLGYALTCDARHMVAPDAESIARCMRAAHRNAGIAPADVSYVSAHGTGTPTNDSVEAEALRQVFGERVPPVSSIKSMLGHTMGAASGFAAIASCIAIRRSFLPPTINWTTPDPEMPWIDPVPNVARPAPVAVVQNNGFAFGGNNAIVVLGAPR